MATIRDATREFLTLKRIAVAGVSGNTMKTGNYIYEKFKKNGYEVFPVNPNATEVSGDVCYPNLSAIVPGVDGVVIATASAITKQIVKECAVLGIKYVWIHKSIDNSSYSEEAEKFCKSNGIKIIPAACPMMYLEPVDLAHTCMKWVFGLTGRIPKTIDF